MTVNGKCHDCGKESAVATDGKILSRCQHCLYIQRQKTAKRRLGSKTKSTLRVCECGTKIYKIGALKCGVCTISDARAQAREARRTQRQKYCPVCSGLPWRRPLTGRCRCGKFFAAEQIEMPGDLVSNAGFCC